MLAWVRFPQACPGSLDPQQRVAHWWQAFHISGKCWFFPDQRVTCDYISCRGTEHRQQLLLIFNTKSQGNSEERLHYYHRYRGMVELSTCTSQLSNAFFFHLCLSCQRCWKHFLSPEKWFGLQCDKCTEWHFIFWFLFSTDKPRGIGGLSSTWGNRNSLRPCFGKKACLVFYLPNQGIFKLRSAAQQAQRPSQSPLPIEEFLWDFKAWFLGFAGSNNPLSL